MLIVVRVSQLNALVSSTMLHLAVGKLSAIGGLLDAVLERQHTKAFRLIIGRFLVI